MCPGTEKTYKNTECQALHSEKGRSEAEEWKQRPEGVGRAACRLGINPRRRPHLLTEDVRAGCAPTISELSPPRGLAPTLPWRG